MKHDFKEPRLARWHEWLIYASIALLTVSGLAWLLLDRFGKVEGDFGLEPHPALPWLLMVHGVVAYAFLVIAAALFPLHVRFGWIKKRNRWSGATLLAVSLFLAATGLVLYYAAAEGLRGSASVAHWVVGIGMPLALVVHVIRGKASRAERRRKIADGVSKDRADTLRRQVEESSSAFRDHRISA
jgi:hypothetical protein